MKESGKTVFTALALMLAAAAPITGSSAAVMSSPGAAAAGAEIASGTSGGNSSAAPALTCSALLYLSLPATRLISATVVEGATGQAGYCHVRGVVAPAISFDLKLPLDNWNHRFYMAGCGGFCGSVDSPNPLQDDGLRRNYAVIVTDTGHSGANALDTSWAVNNPQAIVDYNYRGVHEAARVGKLLAQAYYKKDIAFSYFNGCSNGGRQALMEAARYPDDFDGIIAGSPALDSRLLSFTVHVTQADLGANRLPVLTKPKVALLAKAVAGACGDATGLINAPLSCKFDLAVLACKGADDASCLTKAEVVTIRNLYATPRLKNGTAIYPAGLPYGSEVFWAHPNVPVDAILADDKVIAQAMFRSFSPQLPKDTTIASFDPETQTPLLGTLLQDTTPASDLQGLKKHGAKLLIYHGWAEQTLPPVRTISYYQDAQRSLGGDRQTTARLFMIPGMAHCANPPGSGAVPGFDSDSFDAVTAIEQWVEHGVAPAALPAVKHDENHKPLFTRPICAFPATARYTGTGDRLVADNWRCAAT